MDFKDLPSYTKHSVWAADFPLEYIKRWIDRQTEELNLQLNPDFQRGYVWTPEQQTKYVEHLLKGGVSGRDIYFNCPHWITCSTKGMKYTDFVCVDGLQRLTAVMGFLNDQVIAFGHKKSEFTGRIDSSVMLRFHINDLKTKNAVLNWYIEMNSGGTVHSESEINRVKSMMV